jgi:dTDP-4-amino-4,6-dideoxygalactose transaminase
MPELPKIPILDLAPQVQAHWNEFNATFERVMRSGHFILGPEVEAFESECAAYHGVKHAVGLNSGTDALYIALRALGIGPGDEVITTPFTFFATAEAVSHVGATPVFVDVEEGSFNLDPALVERAVTKRTKAIIPVHLFGRPCDMDSLLAIAREYRLRVVEDCAQSFGARWRERPCGTMGHLGCFSFFPSKNMGAFGDGGMVVTDDPDLATAVRMLRAHGSRKKYFNETVGYNSRLDELQAAMLRVKLRHLDAWNEGRRAAARRYQELLGPVRAVRTPDVAPGHVFHQYTVRLPARARAGCQAKMAEAGVGTMIYYPVPCHRLKLYQASHAGTTCAVAERLAEEVLSLPIWPEIDPATQERVVAALTTAV